jgi:hypothetical protein
MPARTASRADAAQRHRKGFAPPDAPALLDVTAGSMNRPHADRMPRFARLRPVAFATPLPCRFARRGLPVAMVLPRDAPPRCNARHDAMLAMMRCSP